MSEKGVQSSRLLFSLIAISMFLLVFSSMMFLQPSNPSFGTGSFFRLTPIENTSLNFRLDVDKSSHRLPFRTSAPSPFDAGKPELRLPEETCQGSCPNKKNRAFGRLNGGTCNANQTLLRVYMYDLPPEFHFGLLAWKGKEGQIWPDVTNPGSIPSYPGGLNLQHSVEYWLTLDLLASNTPGVVRPCTAVRVKNSREADVIFVPFFSSLSYNRYSKLRGREKISVNKMLQDKLVNFLMNQNEWKRLGGKDHLIVAHHPNSMLDSRRKLSSAMFVLADFGRYPAGIANLEKDIIAPYRHVVRTIGADSAPFEERSILVYFQGAIHRKDGGVIRQELYYLLKDEKDVHFTFGSVRGNGIHKAGQGMASSKFCLNIAGDTPSSNRLFDAIASHCVPVIISDEIELPFEDVLDYSEFCIFVRASDAIKKGFLLNLLRNIDRDTWTKMWERLKKIEHHFEYKYPSQTRDAVDMIWGAVFHKISSIQSRFQRKNRFHRFQMDRKE